MRDLAESRCKKLFTDQGVSGSISKRPAALAFFFIGARRCSALLDPSPRRFDDRSRLTSIPAWD